MEIFIQISPILSTPDNWTDLKITEKPINCMGLKIRLKPKTETIKVFVYSKDNFNSWEVFAHERHHIEPRLIGYRLTVLEKEIEC